MVKNLISVSILFISLAFLGRLSYLQLIKDSSEKLTEDPAIKRVHIYPERGYIYDRDGKLLVGNQTTYDVMVVPRKVREFDKDALCKMLKISVEEFDKRLDRARQNPRLPSVMVAQLDKKDYAILQEKMHRFPGFYIQRKSIRYYNTHAAANVLGFIREVDQADLDRSNVYIPGEMKGQSGVEKQYENILKGSKGVEFIQLDRLNREIGPYKDGALDTLPDIGKEIYITLDKDLQEYGEKLMRWKNGGIVAIEPSSGEILAMISGPTYDPNLLVGRERSQNYTRLYNDSIFRPIWDRSILAEPSPGSPFKVLNALAALQEGAIDTNTRFQCYNGFYVGNVKRGCHCGGGLRDLNTGIYRSCNAYFAGTFRSFYEHFPSTDTAMDVWEKHMKSFGLGNYLGTDLPTGRPGRIPNREYYDKAYGDNRWSYSYIISNAIGQGEVAATPIQLANVMAAIGNRGWYYTPHIIKRIGGNTPIESKFKEKHYTTIDAEHFEPVIKGMADVYRRGTAYWLQIPGVEIAGKTGTVENFTRIDGERVQLTDHSLFVAFAPIDKPKIAIAVFIEHGYYGARYAGHIASLMIEQYLKGTITRKDLEQRMLSKSLVDEYMKPYLCEPFEINEDVW